MDTELSYKHNELNSEFTYTNAQCSTSQSSDNDVLGPQSTGSQPILSQSTHLVSDTTLDPVIVTLRNEDQAAEYRFNTSDDDFVFKHRPSS